MLKTTEATRLRELILHVCRASEGDDRFGSVKLNKILFYSDFIAYLRFGESISGAEYFKLKNGPAPRIMLPLLKDMESAKEFALAERRYYNKTQKRPIALREAELTHFTADQIATVDFIVREFRNTSAAEISELSHQFLGWQAASEGETIPYFTGRAIQRELTEQEQQWAEEIDLTGVAEMLHA